MGVHALQVLLSFHRRLITPFLLGSMSARLNILVLFFQHRLLTFLLYLHTIFRIWDIELKVTTGKMLWLPEAPPSGPTLQIMSTHFHLLSLWGKWASTTSVVFKSILFACHIKYEPPHDKTNKMACASSEDSDQPGHPPSLIRVFAVRMKEAWVLSYPLSAQRRL